MFEGKAHGKRERKKGKAKKSAKKSKDSDSPKVRKKERGCNQKRDKSYNIWSPRPNATERYIEMGRHSVAITLNLQHTLDFEIDVSEEPINADTNLRFPQTAMNSSPPDTKPPIKFSLKTSSSSAACPPLFPNLVTPKDDVYVTEFDGKGMKPANAPMKIIPPIEKSWHPKKCMMNIMLECGLPNSTKECFETNILTHR